MLRCCWEPALGLQRGWGWHWNALHSLFAAHHGRGSTKPFQGRMMPWQEGSTPGIFSREISAGF